MHAFRGENVDGSGYRCRGRGHKDSETSVVKFFNDERGHEGIFNFSQCRLPRLFLGPSRHLPCQTPKEGITWDLFEKRCLDSIARRAPYRCVNTDTNEKTGSQHHEKGEGLFSRQPLGKQLGKRMHKTANRLHSSKQEQNGKINRYEYKHTGS